MPDYSKACIYKIKHFDDFDDAYIYIGATCNLNRRRSKHKITCVNSNKEGHNRNIYNYIRNNGGWENFILIKLFDYPCHCKSELNMEERRIIDLMKPKLNMISSYVTKEELKIKIAERGKEYRDKNKELIKERKKNYYENNKEYVKNKSKIYAENNKEKITERRKKYSEKNSEKLNKKINCECGCIISNKGLKKHIMSKKHQELIKKISVQK